MKSNAFWCKRYMTTIASLRSICLNDLYRHEDLWELAVEGDIHGIVSVLQMSVPWMPNRRERSWEKWGDAPLLALSGNWYQFWEKGLYSLVSSLLRRQPKHIGLVFRAIASAMRLSNSSFELTRVSQCSRFIYYWLSCKQSSGYWIDIFAKGHTHVTVQLG